METKIQETKYEKYISEKDFQNLEKRSRNPNLETCSEKIFDPHPPLLFKRSIFVILHVNWVQVQIRFTK